ncbi:MAG TPA: hypothetical protein VMW52_03255 [Phycisphaerae bacterium]|nr:hypothetical protein [Phycisphaerae bacterium]
METQLGDRVTDSVTGFQGVVTGRAEYLAGEDRLEVTSDTLDKDGKPVEQWFYPGRLVAPRS